MEKDKESVPMWLIIVSAPIGFLLSIVFMNGEFIGIGYLAIMLVVLYLFGAACYKYAGEIKGNKIFAYFLGYCLNWVGWALYHRHYRLTKEKMKKK